MLDELVFAVFININIGIMIGMTDFSQLYNLAILSMVPPVFVLVAEKLVFYNHPLAITHVDAEGKQRIREQPPPPGRSVYLIPMIVSVVLTLLNYVTIVVTHHYAPDPRPITHAAVYVILISQIGWRLVAYVLHGTHKTMTKEAVMFVERAYAFVAVVTCSELVFWAV